MSWLRGILLGCCAIFMAFSAAAHELDPGYLDIREIETNTYQVFWRKPDVRGRPMPIEVRLPENCTPQSGPDSVSDGTAWQSHWVAICDHGLSGRYLSVDGLAYQKTDVLIRLQALDASPVTKRLTSTQTTLLIPEKQSLLQVGWTYAVLGFEHILEGWDHLLFVFALVLLIRSKRRLIGAITAFTVAHSITLALAALGHVSIPGPPVEAIIALSVVFLAIEILKREEAKLRLSERAPWMVAFAFGLLHGLGFAGALQDIGLPEVDIAMALLAFNLGVEAGQLAFVGVVLAAGYVLKGGLSWLNMLSVRLLSNANLVAGYLIGTVATFWVAERIYGF
ncbi:HupE/UreJ family protein [Shimia sagamensis]|uniref:Hydrogenase/urease accessory protein HupE n=1 Tax=Shimia sagamensis TaxID=1566352 RepID=A0ABY1NH95_9RHOB|nr:HupE/UreJ family protein [Shimia sagamensis]SMP09818.1 Hydrogenase/urease accessory protein HupE [Shimia sagamensis]